MKLCYFQAVQNLIVLSRENAGAESIYRQDGIPRLIKAMEGKDAFHQLCAIRALACMCIGSVERVCSSVLLEPWPVCV